MACRSRPPASPEPPQHAYHSGPAGDEQDKACEQSKPTRDEGNHGPAPSADIPIDQDRVDDKEQAHQQKEKTPPEFAKGGRPIVLGSGHVSAVTLADPRTYPKFRSGRRFASDHLRGCSPTSGPARSLMLQKPGSGSWNLEACPASKPAYLYCLRYPTTFRTWAITSAV